MRALLIDDDLKLAKLLSEYLSRFGIELTAAQSSADGLKLLRGSHEPDILILDVMLPDQDGFSLCREIRTESDIPIIMLTARGETTDRIVGLELGADDYLSKPFDPRELVARIQSITRRSSGRREGKSLRFADLEIRTSEREAYLAGKTLELTSMEYELLHFLASHAGKKIDRDEIMNHLRGIDSDVYSRSIDILVSRLRSKLGEDSRAPRFIKTAWGAGYVFVRNPI